MISPEAMKREYESDSLQPRRALTALKASQKVILTFFLLTSQLAEISRFYENRMFNFIPIAEASLLRVLIEGFPIPLSSLEISD